MFIQKATVKDAEIISHIHAESWKTAYRGIVPQKYLDDLKDDYWVAAFQSWIESGAVTALLIYDATLPVGCAAFGRARDKKLADFGEIVSIYLLPEYFGKGCGKTLMLASLSEMEAAGFKDVYLWVLEQNARARRFYEKAGFTPMEDKCYVEIMGERLCDVRYAANLKEIDDA